MCFCKTGTEFFTLATDGGSSSLAALTLLKLFMQFVDEAINSNMLFFTAGISFLLLHLVFPLAGGSTDGGFRFFVVNICFFKLFTEFPNFS